MKVGFIGLGIMGSRMAANLLTAGHDLTVHNRTRDKAAELLARGAAWAETPADAARGADVVITVLAHPQAVEEAALADGSGLLGAMHQGAVWMECSTVNPAFARRMADAAQARGVRFLDAPLAGSKNQAADGSLIFVVGGEAADVETCQPLFEAMGSRTAHIGGCGMGISFKLVLNHLLATSMVAFSEGVHLGVGLGIPREQLLTMLIGTAVVPPFMAGKRDKLATDSYKTEFPLQWMQKDLQMVAEAAAATGTPMPVSNVAKEIYRLAMQYGLSEEDFSSIHHFLAPKRAE